MKKIIAMLLCVLMALSLIACQPAAEPAPAPEAEAAPAPAPAPEVTEADYKAWAEANGYVKADEVAPAPEVEEAPAPEVEEPVAPDHTVADGTYTATAPGFGWKGMITCDVTFSNNRITAVDVVEEFETATGEPFHLVLQKYIPRIIENQSLATDTVAGATVSCVGVRTIIADAIQQAGGKINEWYTPIEKDTDTVVLEGYDVIVVGLGGSGILSFCSAAYEGAKVFGLEKAGKVGGNSATTTGPMAINSEYLKAKHTNGEDYFNPDELYDIWMEYVESDEKEPIIRGAIYESGELLDFYVENFGFEFEGMKGSFAVPTWTKLWTGYKNHPVTGRNALGPNKTHQFLRALDLAISMSPESSYMVETTVTEIITDAAGKAIGVKAVNYDGTVYEVYGDSIIIGTGGFIANEEMMLDTFGYTTEILGWTLCTGDGIKLGQSIGGATKELGVLPMIHIEQVPNLIRNNDLTADQKAILSALALVTDETTIDINGNPISALTTECYVPGFRLYVCYTQAEIDALRENGLTESMAKASSWFLGQGGTLAAGVPVTDIDTILEVGEAYENVISADSIADLAKKLGVDEATLSASLEGVEDKYYAVICAGWAYATVGGLDVNETMNVLREDGTAIENVFAVGQDSEGVANIAGKAYSPWGGQAQSWTYYSGRKAGQAAAAYAAK